LSKITDSLSGAEKALIEINDVLEKEDNVESIIYTSESGVCLYKKLKNFSKTSYVEIGPLWLERTSYALAYYVRCIQIIFFLKKFDKSKRHIIFTHEEFLPSLLFGLLQKLINPSATWITFFHMKAPSFWKGYQGEFTNKFAFPSIRLIRYILEQYFALFITSQFVKKVFTYNTYSYNFILRWYGAGRICKLKNFGGIDVDRKSIRNKKYDIVWVGRIHEQKGVLDIPEIVCNIEKKLGRKIKLALIGVGINGLQNKLFDRINFLQLNHSIEYKGYMSGRDKEQIMKSSKVMIFPSYYESFGIVITEALGIGLPVIAYDLPVYDQFKSAIITTKIGDTEAIAERVSELLSDRKQFKLYSDKAYKLAKNFSWSKTAAIIRRSILH
jgi:glycosyltransferase involved in cell wall biosynthesis